MEKNAMFVMCGGCRTFVDCVDSAYEHVISKLFLGVKTNISIFLYLKLTDPGPRKDFINIYVDCDINAIEKKIHELRDAHNVRIDYKLINGDEISDSELLSLVKDRTKYVGQYYGDDKTLLRGMHCHYNFERCGQFVLEKENDMNIKFDYIIYIRPDLYFTESCETIDKYDCSKTTFGIGGNIYHNDHIAIVPRIFFSQFFFDRMNVYRNNTEHKFITPETVYWCTQPYNTVKIGSYYIKRQF
jgi:hypothetical protein